MAMKTALRKILYDTPLTALQQRFFVTQNDDFLKHADLSDF